MTKNHIKAESITNQNKPNNKKSASSLITHSYWDKVQWILGIVLIAIGAISFSYYTNLPFLYRFFALFAAIAVALLLFWNTNRGKKFLQLMRESQLEVRRVVWPTRSEIWQTILMVAVVVFISALVFWLADIFFAWAIGLIIK